MNGIERIDRSGLNVWASAVPVAALGTWLMYDAMPGIGWVIWTTTASLGALFLLRTPPTLRSPTTITGLVATLIAGGGAVTSDPFMYALIVLGVITFLAMQILLAGSADWNRITARFMIPASVVAFGSAFVESLRRSSEALHLVRSDRARSAVRGIAITLPIVVIFGLLLSSADPIFARWRDAIEHLLSSWDFLPRSIFFVALLSIVLGAYGLTAKVGDAPSPVPGETREPIRRWLGSSERVILLTSVAALLWLFLAVQLTYLFGNVPLAAGSTMTFAEYARRGFGELTVVASASALLILMSERYGEKAERLTLIRVVTIALIVALLFLLGSAFNRVLLYETAYGFTTARLYAQAYMVVVAISLFALAREVFGEIRTPRLFRSVLAAATTAFIVLLYWNHQSWIAGRNIDRFAAMGKLDAFYLISGLSPDAVPTITGRLASLPPAEQSQLRQRLQYRYAGRRSELEGRWYEWNCRRTAARESLEAIGITLDGMRSRSVYRD